jgi:hypothetical protein
MAATVVALIVKRIASSVRLSWPRECIDLTQQRFAGDVQQLQSEALVGESKDC